MFEKGTILLLLSTLSLSAAINPDNICVLVSDGSKIVDDTNCAGYYTCKAGKATAAKCSDGYYFSKNTQNCLPKSEVTCLNANDDPCAGVLGTKFVAMAGSCSGYYYCNNSIAQAGQCPNDLYFNPNLERCVYQSDYNCVPTGGSVDMENHPEKICAYVQNGVFFGSAADCKTWLKCNSTALQSGSCGEYVFNVQTRSCVYQNTYDCQQLKGNTTETGSAPLGSCTETDSTLKVKDPNSCGSYLTCVDKKYVRHSCASGLYFDTVTKTCTTRQQAVNKCDRCEGTTLTFVNNYDDDCQGYLVCKSGKTTGSGVCSGTNHFDEKLGGCVVGGTVNYPACLKCSYETTGCATSSSTASTASTASTDSTASSSTDSSISTDSSSVSTDSSSTVDSSSTTTTLAPVL